MDVFVSSRDNHEALALIGRLKQLGLRGRDAAYLACVAPPPASDPSACAYFLSEFRTMVRPERREAAARLVGLQHW